MSILSLKMDKSELLLQPIGVFDSGTGGLTVVRALRDLLPHEDIFYIGDTARLPYGGKSRQTIERYSIELSGLLLAEGAKMIVVACNTASSLAVSRLQELLKVPVVGVIAPGARAAVKETRIGNVGVIGTKSTIQSEAYERTIRALNPGIRVTSQACPLCGYTDKRNRPGKGLLFICRNAQCPHRLRTGRPYTLHADLVGARNVTMRTLLLRQDWSKTGCLSTIPDASDKEAKAARLQRYAELRWSPEVNPSLRSETGGR